MNLPYFSLSGSFELKEPSNDPARQNGFELNVDTPHESESSTTANDPESENGTSPAGTLSGGKTSTAEKRPQFGFYVNKGGFPIHDEVWERMWQHIERVHPDGITVSARIRENPSLPKLRLPQTPIFTPNMDIQRKLDLVQAYLSELKYNHTGTQFFEIRKNRPICGLMESAKEMIKESLPIKCLEATILAIYLTNGICGLQRFTIGFKTRIGRTYHSHVVLGVYCNGTFGALGLSRRDDLMYKPLHFKSVFELVDDYRQCYNKYFHVLKKLKLSLPIVHDAHSYEHIQWKYININVEKLDKEQLVKILEKFTRLVKTSTSSCSHNTPRNCKKDVLA